jgi:hypothetical protein
MVISFIAGALLGPLVHRVALAQPIPPTAGEFSVPRAWGRVVGAFPGGLVFDANDGTIRVYLIGQGVQFTVNRQ